jgi:hypothetical protein
MSIRRGRPGPQGVQGLQGRSGSDKQGAQGVQGLQGIEGEQGTPGKTPFIDKWLIRAIAVATIVLFIVTQSEINKIDTFNENLSQYAHDACVRQNSLRAIDRAVARGEIEESKNIPNSFFPNIPHDQFKQLIRQGIQEQKDIIEKAAPIPCGELVPQPE